MFEFFDLAQYERAMFLLVRTDGFYIFGSIFRVGDEELPQDSFPNATFFDRASRFSRKETTLESTPPKTNMCPEK